MENEKKNGNGRAMEAVSRFKTPQRVGSDCQWGPKSQETIEINQMSDRDMTTNKKS
jgi:hypothetical protein